MSTAAGRGGGRVPPPRVRPTPSWLRRATAAMVLGLCGLVMAYVAHASGVRPGPGREPPFDLAHPDIAHDVNEVVLYVSERCPWCALELAAWSHALGQDPTRAPLVVLSPGSSPEAVAWIPEAVRARWLHDTDGTLGRMLGVTAVPMLARIDAGGRVVAVTVGLSSVADRTALLEHLTPHPPLAGVNP